MSIRIGASRIGPRVDEVGAHECRWPLRRLGGILLALALGYALPALATAQTQAEHELQTTRAGQTSSQIIMPAEAGGNTAQAVHGSAVSKPRELPTWDLYRILYTSPSNNAYVRIGIGRFRAELHDRFAAPLFPFACMMIAFAALGSARTTRQQREDAILTAIAAICTLRIAMFGISALVVRDAWVVSFDYLAPIGATLIAAFVAFRGGGFAGLLKRRLGALHQGAIEC